MAKSKAEVKAPQRERVDIDTLSPHPQNYRSHPADQLEHIVQSLQEHGLYRNVVVAKDGTLLAGHGVWEAAKSLGWTEIDVVRVDVAPDDPSALKILTGDNELSLLAEIDDRLLADLLKLIQDEADTGLLGTGYDEEMLANLVFITRPVSEIVDQNDAAQWVGLPQYEGLNERPLQAHIYFKSEEDVAAFLEKLDITTSRTQGRIVSAWWPNRPLQDLRSVRWDEQGDEQEQ